MAPKNTTVSPRLCLSFLGISLLFPEGNQASGPQVWREVFTYLPDKEKKREFSGVELLELNNSVWSGTSSFPAVETALRSYQMILRASMRCLGLTLTWPNGQFLKVGNESAGGVVSL